jgi:hypothetical protein
MGVSSTISSQIRLDQKITVIKLCETGLVTLTMTPSVRDIESRVDRHAAGEGWD